MTMTSGLADKGVEEGLSLTGAKTSDSSRLGDLGMLHYARCLDLTNRGERTNQVVRPHLRDTLFLFGQREDLLKGEFATLHELFDFGTTTTIRHGHPGGGDSLLLVQGRRNRAHD
jgi:hypothetical protein